MSYAVEFTPGAEDDLVRLYEFLLDRAETLEDLDVADEAIKVIRQAALSHLSTTPYSYRKVGAWSTLRELIIRSARPATSCASTSARPSWYS